MIANTHNAHNTSKLCTLSHVFRFTSCLIPLAGTGGASAGFLDCLILVSRIVEYKIKLVVTEADSGAQLYFA